MSREGIIEKVYSGGAENVDEIEEVLASELRRLMRMGRGSIPATDDDIRRGAKAVTELFFHIRFKGSRIRELLQKHSEGKLVDRELCREILMFAEHGDYSNRNVEFGTDEGMVRAGECLDEFRQRLAIGESKEVEK